MPRLITNVVIEVEVTNLLSSLSLGLHAAGFMVILFDLDEFHRISMFYLLLIFCTCTTCSTLFALVIKVFTI